ncbi:hypothetical protein TPHA_0I00940 [Tetrapisispora phaffii CBS 4417]|uniref:Potassium channel domain-containing protein n=1 Tax=Tetrapisispora phaffii (strain ATCC 24235 / CBS 4417 / NBRC 1672 / NRRL Y-8282 / UCD 70-5) TaxID=1071381 RepID=G8BXH2_TETPH|nr:hypothetical protein TPHA_0I00940 [Tetrapisispora phaffii CBS 4417]CCE64600.1 hypothetical protein TPHA_0I00940 [Tetrapisispora phaffii CBS 4417]
MDHNDTEKYKFDYRSVDPSLKEALEFRSERVDIINANPDSKTFVLWFIISCYFPVITACMGPIANALSVACAVEKWREKWEIVDGSYVSYELDDPAVIFTLNIISFVIGICSNGVLILHFAQKVSYQTSQIINITGWTVSGLLLLVDVVVSSIRYTYRYDYHLNIGFWFAVITCALYFCCALVLSLHYVGYKLRKYPARFNLVKNERAVMVFTVLFSIWLIWGAGLFSGLLHINYCTAMYFSVVSLLTVGLGDILPKTVAAKIMILVFSLSGVLLLGLIIVMTRDIIQGSIGPIFYFHRLEESRIILTKKIHNKELTVNSTKDAFRHMNRLRKQSKRKQVLFSLLLTICIFITFWLLGAVVFMFAESWSYFNSLYFCFLCLLTIGYGDFAPSTGAGRAFFVIWAILAVPLMSAIISTVGDTLFTLAQKLDFTLGKRIFHQDLKALVISNTYSNSKSILRFKTGELFTATNLSDVLLEEIDDDNDNSNEDIVDGSGSGNSLNSNVSKAENNSLTNQGSQQNSNTTSDSCALSIKPKTHFIPYHNIENPNLNSDRVVILTQEETHDRLLKLQELLRHFSDIHNNRVNDHNCRLSYNDWKAIAEENLLDTQDCLPQDTSGQLHIDPMFWVSSNTPLRFPIDESRFAMSKLFRKMVSLTNELIDSENCKIENDKSCNSSSIESSPISTNDDTFNSTHENNIEMVLI